MINRGDHSEWMKQFIQKWVVETILQTAGRLADWLRPQAAGRRPQAAGYGLSAEQIWNPDPDPGLPLVYSCTLFQVVPERTPRTSLHY
jgi:hypothetical protein